MTCLDNTINIFLLILFTFSISAMRITLIIGLFSFYIKLECLLWSLETAEWRPATKALFQWCCHFHIATNICSYTEQTIIYSIKMFHSLYKATLIQFLKKSILLYHSIFIMIKLQNHCYSYTDSSLLNMFTYLCHSRVSPPRESVCSPTVVMPKSWGIPILCFRHKATRHMCTLCCTRLPKR